VTDTGLYACEVSVVTEYLAAQSSPAAGQYVYAYTITIRNTGKTPVQLISTAPRSISVFVPSFIGS